MFKYLDLVTIKDNDFFHGLPGVIVDKAGIDLYKVKITLDGHTEYKFFPKVQLVARDASPEPQGQR